MSTDFKEHLASKLFAATFGILFFGLGAMWSKKVIELIASQKHDIDLYETSEIYVDFGLKGYCGFHGTVASFFMGIGLSFIYLGLLKRNKYRHYGLDFEVNYERVLH